MKMMKMLSWCCVLIACFLLPITIRRNKTNEPRQISRESIFSLLLFTPNHDGGRRKAQEDPPPDCAAEINLATTCLETVNPSCPSCVNDAMEDLFANNETVSCDIFETKTCTAIYDSCNCDSCAIEVEAMYNCVFSETDCLGLECDRPTPAPLTTPPPDEVCYEVANDPCAFALDMQCDVGTVCAAGTDCFDCDPFKQYNNDGCSGCISKGGFYCERADGKGVCSDPIMADLVADFCEPENGGTEWKSVCNEIPTMTSEPTTDATAPTETDPPSITGSVEVPIPEGDGGGGGGTAALAALALIPVAGIGCWMYKRKKKKQSNSNDGQWQLSGPRKLYKEGTFVNVSTVNHSVDGLTYEEERESQQVQQQRQQSPQWAGRYLGQPPGGFYRPRVRDQDQPPSVAASLQLDIHSNSASNQRHDPPSDPPAYPPAAALSAMVKPMPNANLDAYMPDVKDQCRSIRSSNDVPLAAAVVLEDNMSDEY